MKNTIAKNTIYLYSLTIVKTIFPFITLPYLTRILSVDMFGFVSYVKAYNSYVQLFLDFGFLLSATKSVVEAKGSIKSISYITWNTIIEKFILGLIALCFTIGAVNFIPLLRMDKTFVWLYFISSIITIFIPDFMYRGIEKMEYATIPFVISKVIVFLLTITLIKSDSNVLLIPILEVGGNTAATIVSLFFIKKVGITFFVGYPKQWLKDIKESSIYFFSNFATTFFGTLTTLITGLYLPANEIAYWSSSMQVVTVAKSMYNPIVNSLYPHMVLKKDLKLVKRISVVFIIPLFVGSVIVFFWGGDIMSMIQGKEYYVVGKILKYLLPVFIASFYSMLYGWPVLGSINLVKETTVTTICAAALQVICIGVIVFFEEFNLLNLAICCCISEIGLLLFRLCFLIKNKEKFKKDENVVE